MRIKELEVSEFRKFSNAKIHFGKNMTCISGYNAVGKSTILGLLANAAEYVKKDGVTIDGNPYKVDLKDIIKFSPEYDHTISQVYNINWDDSPDSIDYPSSLEFRSTWQDENTRYRLIPKKTAIRKTEKKIKWPTLYLGLSRLYPVGEVLDEEITEKKFSSTDREEISNIHKQILSSSDTYNTSSSIDLINTKKNGYGVETDTYGPLSNSAGQDNLGQILKALFSMKKLKEKQDGNWMGGQILIDEIDATLHPAAQNKLIDFINEFSDEHSFQVIFTTHSLSLLEHIWSKHIENAWTYRRPDSTANLKAELVYISNAYGDINIHRNPEISTIKRDLSNMLTNTQDKSLMIYSEDNEARWFFDNLYHKFKVDDFITKDPITFEHINVSLGWSQLLKLLTGDYKYFSKTLILLDGDVKDAEINSEIRVKTPLTFDGSQQKDKVILRLPGAVSVEQLFWEYSNTIEEAHDFYRTTGDLSFNKRIFTENGPFSPSYTMEHHDRDKYKKWFNDNIYYMKLLFEYWYRDNKNDALKFLTSLASATRFAMSRNTYSGAFIINDEKIHESRNGG